MALPRHWIALVATLLLAGSAAASEFEDADVAHVQAQLARSRNARVVLADRTFKVAGPRAEAKGLVYRTPLDWPPRRPAVFATVAWDTLPPPPNPVPWPAIERLEVEHRDRRTAALWGAGIGATLGILTGISLNDWARDSGHGMRGGEVLTVVVGGVYGLAGAGIGSLLVPTHWRAVEPRAPEPSP